MKPFPLKKLHIVLDRWPDALVHPVILRKNWVLLWIRKVKT